ncbi:sce7726 family protein [Sphingobacterium sp. MYb382]|uniref:sce7726 family protein n=1 Tax=Sphingobacterium sp. MYb382 TaxID=2745278 RepID=UPI00309ABE44
MQSSATYGKPQLRELASMVSHAAFKKLGNTSNQSAYIRRMKKYVDWDKLEETKPKSLADLISFAYQILEQQYRHEYIYKNKLLNDYVLKNYALDDAILLNEFRVGQSIADAVLVNGTNKVFEIKTELDNPERLLNQLNDYYKAFTEVYLFTHSSLVAKYLNILPEYVGVLTYTEDGAVIESREAKIMRSNLDVTFMIASLRKPEYTKLVQQLVGFLPDVNPVNYYRACLEILQALVPSDVQNIYCQVLKNRIDLATNIYLGEAVLPSYLNFSFYQSQFNKKSYLTLINNLNKNL